MTHRRTTTAVRRRASLLAACALALALAACGSEEGSGDGADTTAPPAPTVVPTVSASTTSTTTAASATTAPPITFVLPATTVPPEWTGAPVDSPAPVTAPPTTTAPLPTRPLVAVNDSGDAVLFAADGPTVLLDGEDPDDIVEEGPVVLVDSVVVTDDRSVSLVSTCCEPSPGTLFRTAPPAPTPLDGADTAFGHGLDLSLDGSRIAYVAVDAVVVSDLAFEGETFLSAPSQDTYPDAVMWSSANRLIVLDSSASGTTLRAVDIDAAGVMTWTVSSQISTVPADREATMMLAGRAGGIVFVADVGSNVVHAFDATSLAAVPSSDVTLASPPLSVWAEDGEVRWIDGGRTLHVGDATMPGSYLWVH